MIRRLIALALLPLLTAFEPVKEWEISLVKPDKCGAGCYRFENLLADPVSVIINDHMVDVVNGNGEIRCIKGTNARGQRGCFSVIAPGETGYYKSRANPDKIVVKIQPWLVLDGVVDPPVSDVDDVTGDSVLLLNPGDPATPKRITRPHEEVWSQGGAVDIARLVRSGW